MTNERAKEILTPCEKQIKIGTKVRTTKDKDFACEKVFPVGTIGIVERIDKGDNLPYKIVANNDYFYYSRDMFEIIEDVEPCTDAVSREAVIEWLKDKDIIKLKSQEENARKELRSLPSVNPQYKECRTLDEFIEDSKESCEELINALPPVNPQPCDDAISQNQSNACSILDDECPYPYKHCWECSLHYQYELAKHELDKNVELPSVTQKSKTGHWITDDAWSDIAYNTEFLEFLYNHINPNDMEHYRQRFEMKDAVAVNGAEMESEGV